MASIQNVHVYGLAESIYRSGYPMMDHAPSEQEFDDEIWYIQDCLETKGYDFNPHIKRAIKLANTPGGGHDQFLTGIVVQFDLTLTNKAWVEAERYTFLNFISSMSTMHRVAMFQIRNCCNQYVSEAEIVEAERLQALYNSIDGQAQSEEKKEAYLNLLFNLPSGFELMAGMTTNYRCLKNMRSQRRHHRLPDWHVVCDWIETLPMAPELICGGDINT